MAERGRYWVAVCYPENMISNWQEEISSLIEVPFAYCVHDKDIVEEVGENRKVHVHIMVAYSNTTTYKNVMNIFNRLSAPNKVCVNTCKTVINVERMYNYLIHDTDDCRKKGKFLYPKNERVVGNNFDIGNYIILSSADKCDMVNELCKLIIDECISNFADFYFVVMNDYDDNYLQIVKENSGLFERLTRGIYLKLTKKTM